MIEYVLDSLLEEVRNSTVQPEADELPAALAPETDADKDSSVISEEESASDDDSDYSIYRVHDTGGESCSICRGDVTLHCTSDDKCPLVDYYFPATIGTTITASPARQKHET